MKSKNSLQKLLDKCLDAMVGKDSRWYTRLIAFAPFTLLLGAYLFLCLLEYPDIFTGMLGAVVTILTAPSLPVALGLIAVGAVLALAISRRLGRRWP